MARSGPTTLALPSFSGATRKLILWNLGIFFGVAILGRLAPVPIGYLLEHLVLNPVALLHGQVWQLATYAFMPTGLIGMLFAMLSLWFAGALLEGERGARWLYELYFASVIGGGLIASAIALTGVIGMDPTRVIGVGAQVGVFGLLAAVALLMGDMEFMMFFVLRLKAKYLVAIYVLWELATLLTDRNAFYALLLLSAMLSAFLFLRLVPRKGLAYGVTERFYGMRNEYYRAKRRRAARKFEVYMRKQNREVHFDKDGRYVDPDKDPTDKRWMN